MENLPEYIKENNIPGIEGQMVRAIIVTTIGNNWTYRAGLYINP